MSGAFDPAEALRRLRAAWGPDTSTLWRADNPARGQCAPTALLLLRRHGLPLLKTPLPEGWHFYNAWEDGRLDLTESQFARHVSYQDLPATEAEAEAACTPAQRAALEARYRVAPEARQGAS